MGAAAVGGASYLAGKHVANNRNAEAMQDQQIADLQYQAAAQEQDDYYADPAPPTYASPPPAPAPSGDDDVAARLQKLSQLHDSGALSDDEFAAAKQKVLAGG